jgi:hypothetical protein
LNTGDQAYELVRAYSDMGVHRTGSAVDIKTSRWLASELVIYGADVSFQTFPYHHFEVELAVRSDLRSVRAMALYYSFTGPHNVINPATGVIDAHADEVVISGRINTMVTQAKADGSDGLVLATQCPTGAICAINRAHSTDINLPVILVAEEDLTTIQASGADIYCSAAIRIGEATNIIAQFPGPPGASAIVVTTPISGWFQCAGERGSGLAAAILVAQRLSRNFAVDLLLASGHELGFLGGYHLAENLAAPSGCILHLGSCIANLEARFTSVCSFDPTTTGQIAAALQILGIRPVVPTDPGDAENWVGESKCWASKGLPMLSIAGQAPYFHTPDDLPDTVTTPHLLESAIDAIYDAAFALADQGKTG